MAYRLRTAQSTAMHTPPILECLSVKHQEVTASGTDVCFEAQLGVSIDPESGDVNAEVPWFSRVQHIACSGYSGSNSRSP